MKSTIRTSARTAAGRAFAGLAIVALAACSSAPADEAPVTVTSDTGALRVTLQMSSQPVQRGIDSAELAIAGVADGGPVDGLALAITPWMPAMDHGTSVVPTVTALGGGRYQVTNLVLYMTGHWELLIAIGDGASGSTPTDHAAPAVDVP
jgi:hypothetical protein